MLTTTGEAFAHTNPNPNVFLPSSRPFGRTYAQWSVRWWQRALALTPDQFNDPHNCSFRQSGPVWFLNGTTGGLPVTRSCTIPSGKAIMFPILNIATTTLPPLPVCSPLSSFPADADTSNTTLRNCAIGYINNTTELEADIDGQALQALMTATYLVISPPFHFKIVNENAFRLTPGSKGRAISDGIWIILKPLRPGVHHLHFLGKAVFPSGTLPPFTTEVTYTLTIGH